MDFRVIIVFLGIGLFGCGTGKNNSSAEVSTDNKAQVMLKLSARKPYCGGAAPTPAQQNGFSEAIAERSYYVYKGEFSAEKEKHSEFTTNGQGVTELKLDPGTYTIVDVQKLLSLEEFIQANTINDPNYQNRENKCFELWKAKPDFTINVQNDTLMMLTERHNCFTGANPCIQYTGPYPP